MFFLAAWGIWAMYRIPLDAIPDLSDVQVIVFTEYPGQGPRIVEDQVTYPLTTAMLAVPKAKVVRGYSFFGFSFVYIIFEDGTDIYWARSRVLEYLNYVSKRLPAGVTPTLGPDATGVGLGVRVRPRGQDGEARSRPVAVPPGLVPPVRADRRGRGLRGRLHRRAGEAVPGGRPPRPARRLRDPDPEGPHGDPAQQQRRGRTTRRDGRRRSSWSGVLDTSNPWTT